MPEREFEVKLMVKSDTETVAEGIESAQNMMLKLGFLVYDVKPLAKLRTPKQNDALHLYFDQLADALNSAGYDMRKTIRTGIEISWTADNIKEYLWRPVQISLLKKESTTELDTKEIDKVYEQINRVIGERCGVHVPFPSVESLIHR